MRDLVIDTAPVFEPLLHPARYKGVHGGRGGAKCLGKGTNVTMLDGSLRMVEDIKVGDQLLGIDGTPRNVGSVTSGTDMLYLVQQTTGHQYVTNGEHILALEQSSSSILEGRYKKGSGGLISSKDYANCSERFKSQFFGYKRAGVFSNATQPIEPYFIGAWIGDGDSARPALTTADTEIVEYLTAFSINHGCRLSKFGKKDNLAAGYLVARNNGSRQENTITAALRGLNLIQNKHIPHCYFAASECQRLDLLAGIIDTDGTVHNNCYTVTMAREELLRQIKRVADSLGFKTGFKKAKTSCNGKSFAAWRLSICGDVWRIPCRVERKKITSDMASKNKDWRRTRVDVKPIGIGEYFGFELDGDHLFFLDDFTVTHNSHFFAELMVEENIQHKLDNVCLRETLKSLEFSVKKLLEMKIESMNVGSYFEVQDRRILTKSGGVIIFEGMQSHTAESIKSLEGFDRAWFEEAQAASQKSLDLLRPTIRKPNSEMWFSWNPDSSDDPIDQLLRGPFLPPGAVVVESNYMDNPWFPDVLKAEMEYDRSRDHDKYNHIWLGQYKQHSEARIFKNWTIEEFERPLGTIYRMGADWGFSVDPSVLVRSSIEGNRLYVDYEAYMIGCEIVNLPDLFDRVPESRKWFITADSARPETISYMRKNGYPKINPTEKGKGSIEEGITFLQSFDIIVHPRCVHLIDELKSYKYKRDPLTDKILGIIEDKNNHVIDALRYACEGARKTAATKKTKRPISGYEPLDEAIGY